MGRHEFSLSVRRNALKRCTGKDGIPRCEECGQSGRLEFDHDKPDGLGGDATLENCVVRCVKCHKTKTHTEDRPIMAKADRMRKKHFLRKPSRFPASRDSRWKRKISGEVVER